MKVGIASNDEHSIANHFGRTKGFIIAELVKGEIKSKEYRPNNFTHHSHQGTHEPQGGHHHSHASILSALKDCEVVISRGMGKRIYDDLRGANIEAIITDIADVEEAITAYFAGTLVDNPEKGCVH
ncbi:MAG: iron-molybdenum cofactor biosynthesis protein [FCB group bacterium]|nr:iron-molybdenum cofactor biosynthesis protein [FCB group bacterium]MBL7027027.1 iron-molybdenum cofactor biosynthesis protein [Candidatus Neomarinimicrobiota bacterium]MBL7122207.1 iron-molybdenum cofactor biosynthesis protein [Candidatus Neomarinimicrobiota bacterium]